MAKQKTKKDQKEKKQKKEGSDQKTSKQEDKKAAQEKEKAKEKEAKKEELTEEEQEKLEEKKEKAEKGDILSEVEKKNPFHVTISENEEAAKKADWYVVHTFSGREKKTIELLKTRIRSMGIKDKIFEILVPTQEKIQIKKGEKKNIKEKIFPGYMLIKMIVDDDSWRAVVTTQGVTSFVGTSKRPTPISEKEVEAIKEFMEMEAPKYKSTYSVGEAIKITEGPFADFLGTVDKIDEEKGKIHVLVSIFGRETPVELDFSQVDKV